MKYCNLFVFLLWIIAFSSLVLAEEQAQAVQENVPSPRSKNWNKIDYNGLEKQWESGDADEELEHDFEQIRKIQEKKRPKINMEDGNAIRNAYQQDPFLFSGGGMMVFVDLKPNQPDGSPWTKQANDKLTKRYNFLLRNGGIVCTLYNIEDKRLLVNLDKSWLTKELMTFLAKQPEVESFTANSKTYNPKEYLASIGEEEDDDDEDL